MFFHSGRPKKTAGNSAFARSGRRTASPESPIKAAAAAAPEIELGASFSANPCYFTAVAPNKRAAASSAGNSPLPDLSPLGEENDEAKEEDDADDVAAKAEMLMRRLKRVMFDMDDAADDEVDDGLQHEYSTKVWDGLSFKEQVALYDDDVAQGYAASAAASTGGVGGGGFRAGCDAVGGASIPMSRSDSRSTKRVNAPLTDSLAAAGAPGASLSAPKARASYKQSDADKEFFLSSPSFIVARFYALLLSA